MLALAASTLTVRNGAKLPAALGTPLVSFVHGARSVDFLQLKGHLCFSCCSLRYKRTLQLGCFSAFCDGVSSDSQDVIEDMDLEFDDIHAT